MALDLTQALAQSPGSVVLPGGREVALAPLGIGGRKVLRALQAGDADSVTDERLEAAVRQVLPSLTDAEFDALTPDAVVALLMAAAVGVDVVERALKAELDATAPAEGHPAGKARTKKRTGS